MGCSTTLAIRSRVTCGSSSINSSGSGSSRLPGTRLARRGRAGFLPMLKVTLLEVLLRRYLSSFSLIALGVGFSSPAACDIG